MSEKIRQIALEYLDSGAFPEEVEIDRISEPFKISPVKWVGSLMITDYSAAYLVIFEQLRPLHGGDSHTLVTSITPMS